MHMIGMFIYSEVPHRSSLTELKKKKKGSEINGQLRFCLPPPVTHASRLDQKENTSGTRVGSGGRNRKMAKNVFRWGTNALKKYESPTFSFMFGRSFLSTEYIKKKFELL